MEVNWTRVARIAVVAAAVVLPVVGISTARVYAASPVVTINRTVIEDGVLSCNVGSYNEYITDPTGGWAMACFVNPSHAQTSALLAAMLDWADGSCPSGYMSNTMPVAAPLGAPTSSSAFGSGANTCGNIAITHGPTSTGAPGNGGGLPENYFIAHCTLCYASGWSPYDLYLGGPHTSGSLLSPMNEVFGIAAVYGYARVWNLITTTYSDEFYDDPPPAFDGLAGFPDPVCVDFNFDAFARNGGSQVPNLSDVPALGGGDTLSFDVEHATTLVPIGAASLEFRWQPNQAWSSLLDHPEGTIWTDRRVSIAREGATVFAAELEVRCLDLDGYSFWRWDTGWGDAGATDVCADYEVAMLVDHDGVTDGYISFEAFLAFRDPRVSDPVTIQATIDHDGTPAGVANFSLRFGAGAGSAAWAGIAFATVIGGTTSLPLVDVVELGDDPVDLRELVVTCTPGGGGTPSEWDGDGWEPVDGEVEAGCYRFGGMSLTSPSSWLRGAGGMFVCLGEWLFVPDGEVIGDEWGELSASADEHVPVAWITNGVELVGDSVAGMDDEIEAHSGDCFVWLPAGSFRDWSWEADSACPHEAVEGVSEWSTIRAAMGEVVWWGFGFLVLMIAVRIVGGGGGGGGGGDSAVGTSSSDRDIPFMQEAW